MERLAVLPAPAVRVVPVPLAVLSAPWEADSLARLALPLVPAVRVVPVPLAVRSVPGFLGRKAPADNR